MKYTHSLSVRTPSPLRATVVGMSIGLASLAMGCGDKSGRVNLSGNVTWKGQPVPTGMVIINPDVSKGNVGPQGMAEIRDGKYDTAALNGRTVTPGAIILNIHAYDGLNRSEDQPHGTRMFKPFELPAVTPETSETLDIEVPADVEAL